MKNMKKIFALLITLVIVFGMSTSVFAASITVNRDDTYAGTGDGREYEYYKVFSASYASTFSQNFDGGYDDDGNAVTEQGDGKVSYTANATVGGILQNTAGNNWFDAVEIPGKTPKEYVVTWKDTATVDADTLQAAAAWLIENGAYEEGPTALTFADGAWTSGDIDPGYYIISSDTGNNLAAVTTDIEIDEKNDYPPIDKTQEDEDATEPIGNAVNVAIGDSVTYYAKVTIPKTAKVGDKMVVSDTPSAGLSYNDDVAVDENDGNAAVAFNTPAATGNQAWTATITVTDGSQGEDVIFKYTMTITEDALVDTERINTFDLKFGDHYTAIPKSVPYITYFTGIEKIDGETDDPLEGVVFTLTEDGAAFNVTLTADGWYIPGGTSNEVETDEDGLIIIRGLDDDKEYVLTEKENPIPGYNMLAAPYELTLVEDTANTYATDNFDQVENNKGTVLPSTGGMGTTIFYIIGAILVIGAGVVLVTRRRVRK